MPVSDRIGVAGSAATSVDTSLAALVALAQAPPGSFPVPLTAWASGVKRQPEVSSHEKTGSGSPARKVVEMTDNTTTPEPSHRLLGPPALAVYIRFDTPQDRLAIADGAELMKLYLALSRREQERAWNFTQDAQHRTEDLAAGDDRAERDHTAVEAFASWLYEVRAGTPTERLLYLHDLTPEQHARYLAAWETIQAVHREVKATVAEKYGHEAEGGEDQ